MTDPRPVALVVQRYGADLIGGAESLCRTIAQMLNPYRRVEVITTCAKDYFTWRNEYPVGTSTVEGVLVHRFPVDFERDASFHVLFNRMLGGLPLSAYQQHKAAMRALVARGTLEDQERFIREQGPYSTPMLNYLATEHEKYSAVFFITYLYAPTYFGSQVVPKAKTILAPTAHDEAVIFVPAYRSMFQRIGAFAFLTPEEREFVTETFGIDHAYRATIGMPVNVTRDSDEATFRRKHRIRGPFLLYAGRIDPTKGCADLFKYYAMSRKYLGHDLPLILIGSREMSIPKSHHIRYLGHLSEEDKASAMAAATAVINPSPFESFSIVTLEAMAAGAPVLVNGQSEVLKGHVQRSSAGLFYEGGAEFVEALRLLLSGSAEWRRRLGQNGRAYVKQNYDQTIMAARYQRLVEQVIVKSNEMETAQA